MPVVTRLKALGKRAARIAVELDNAPWAELEAEVVLRNALENGQSLDDEAQRKLMEENAFVKARRAAAILLNTRPRATEELRRLLIQRGHDPDIALRVVEYFAEKGDLDDAAFAKIWTRNQLKTRKVGPRRITARLKQLGVDTRAIDAALEEQIEDDQQRASVERLIERRAARLARQDPAVRRRRLQGALARAGFEPEVYRPLLEEALNDMKETEDTNEND